MVDFKQLSDFGGLVTSLPEDKIPERNASDLMNIDLSQAGMIQTSGGFSEYGSRIENEPGSNLRGFLYKKGFGTLKRVKLRVRDNGSKSVLEWLNASNTANSAEGEWELLVDNLTQGAVMGFTAFNQSNANQLIFCNAVDNYSTWNGVTGVLASVTATTIVIDEDVAFEGFDATGSILVAGTEYAYTGISASTFTGVTPDPTIQSPSAGSGVTQKPDTTTHTTLPKGNILLTASARVWLAGVTDRPGTMYYSKVADATNYTAADIPDGAGIEDFPDGGGAITLLDSKDNSKIIIHKEDGIMVFTLEYTSTAKVPNLEVLTLADDSGATNLKAGAGLNQVSYFTTHVEGLKELSRAIEDANLNMSSITDIILPTIAEYDFTSAACQYYPKKRAIFVACKSKSSKTHNDMLIAYYIRKNSDGNYIGDISIFDSIKASDFILDRNEIFFVSSVDQNTYKLFDRNSANGSGITHRYTTKAFTFGDIVKDKEFDILYIEGLIAYGTKIKISSLYGMFGSKASKEEIIVWNDNTYVSSQKISALGVDVLGTVSLGASSQDILDSFPFQVAIHMDVLKANQFKIKFETIYDEDTVDEAYWAILNTGFNPRFNNFDTNKIINSEN